VIELLSVFGYIGNDQVGCIGRSGKDYFSTTEGLLRINGTDTAFSASTSIKREKRSRFVAYDAISPIKVWTLSGALD
jgi:hypothetical protein